MTTVTTEGLTERQQRMLDFIRRYIRRHGWAPTIREIGEGCAISSTSIVSYNLVRLADLGLIRRGGPGAVRAIAVTRLGEAE